MRAPHPRPALKASPSWVRAAPQAMTSTVRITSEHVNNPQFQGQAVRAVGKLLSVDASSGLVQLELTGEAGARRRARAQATRRTLRATLTRSRALWLLAAANVTVSCQQGTHKYLLETVGKGFYEVIGTLQAGGNITEMNTVFMGENFGERATVRAPALPTSIFPPLVRLVCAAAPQTPTCTCRWSS